MSDKKSKSGYTIALTGNPNCGKTTLFNGLTGGKQRVGNWAGVTVEKKEGLLKGAKSPVNVVDLPGIYSLSAHSEDEQVARDYILSGEPDLVVNILDSTNLERNLYLTLQLIEMNVPVVLVLNMLDMAAKQNIIIKADLLAKKLGLPVYAISALKKEDIVEIKNEIEFHLSRGIKPAESGVEYPNEVEDVVSGWQTTLEPLARELGTTGRWVALKLLEGDPWVTARVTKTKAIEQAEIEKSIANIEEILDDTTDIILADYSYGFIHSVASSVVTRKPSKTKLTDRIDKIVINRFLGIPIFLAVMYVVFWVAINVGGAFIDFFDILFGAIFVDGLGTLMSAVGAPEWLVTIIAGGLGSGIQTVATFVPIIFFMFLMLSILEDSGYMARAAFVMDRFMRLIGLPGKSFIPMLVGFGCTVPAVMATRTLDSKKDRILTVFMTPFMSCGARLPVYVLFAAAFFTKSPGLMVFSLYLVGIIFAILTGLLLKKTLLKGEVSHFIMELPPYHRPRFKHIMLHTLTRLKGFTVKAGTMITLIVAVLAILNSVGTDGTFGNEDSENSVLTKIGTSITPIFEPMGVEKDNWPAAVAIFTGLFAKEAVVGTLNSLYGQIESAGAEGEAGEEEAFSFTGAVVEAFATIPGNLAGLFDPAALLDPLGLGLVGEVSEDADKQALAEEVGAEDEGIFLLMRSYFRNGQAQAYAYLLFILLYLPCLAAFGAILKEIGNWMGTLLGIYLTLLGWATSTLFYQIAVGHNILWIVVSLAIYGAIIASFYFVGREQRRKEALKLGTVKV